MFMAFSFHSMSTQNDMEVEDRHGVNQSRVGLRGFGLDLLLGNEVKANFE